MCVLVSSCELPVKQQKRGKSCQTKKLQTVHCKSAPRSFFHLRSLIQKFERLRINNFAGFGNITEWHGHKMTPGIRAGISFGACDAKSEATIVSGITECEYAHPSIFLCSVEPFSNKGQGDALFLKRRMNRNRRKPNRFFFKQKTAYEIGAVPETGVPGAELAQDAAFMI